MRRVRVTAPATSANVGPGFDSLGLALSLYNSYEVEEAEGVHIEGCPARLAGADNLFVLAFRRGLEALGRPFRGLRLSIDSAIPIARGLGSSAACIVGGLASAEALSGLSLGSDAMLDLATELEGHPDNVAPAILGGFCVSIADGGRVFSRRAPISGRLRFHALVPAFELSTKKARSVLPRELVFKEAVRNVGRASLVVASFFSGDYGLLRAACADSLHEPYRSPLIPGFAEVSQAARASGALAVYLSGAGPTIMAIEEVGAEGGPSTLGPLLDPLLAGIAVGGWRRVELCPDPKGCRVEELANLGGEGR